MRTGWQCIRGRIGQDRGLEAAGQLVGLGNGDAGPRKKALACTRTRRTPTYEGRCKAAAYLMVLCGSVMILHKADRKDPNKLATVSRLNSVEL